MDRKPNRSSGARERPYFLITIDTEGDNLWSKPREITTRNAKFLPRFQALCETYRLKSTYLTNYEMATCHEFQEFGLDILRRATGEIGMHLHAWNSPPVVPLTEDDYAYQPYLMEYPQQLMRDKIVYLTDVLEQTFAVIMTSHRAGRWGFNEVYARILAEEGYRVDCSVTPRVSWKYDMGDPQNSGGTDYSPFPDRPYFLNLEDIQQPGRSSLLEVPVTILSLLPASLARLQCSVGPRSLAGRVVNHFFPSACWLRPKRGNLNLMLRILRLARRQHHECVEFMLHSSEFMPGGSPSFPRTDDIERLYGDLEVLFEHASKEFQGATLTEFARRFMDRESVRD